MVLFYVKKGGDVVIIVNIIRFVFGREDAPHRGRHGVFFHVSGNNRGEAWLSFFEWLTVSLIIALIAMVAIWFCRL